MARVHADSADIIDVRPLGAALDGRGRTAFFESAQTERVHLVRVGGKAPREHRMSGAMTSQCIERLIG